jgi:glycine/D-amino acid oxidase-like deaminating enzyme
MSTVDLRDSYDVVCVGGALMGSSSAYFLSENPDFDGSILVVEGDPTYESAMTTRAQNSIREQFSNPVNIRISQFGMDFIENFQDNVSVDGHSPAINFRGTGYLFIAKDDAHLARLASQIDVQHDEGANTRMLTPGQVKDEFPYMNVDTIVGARVGSMREGSFDGWALLQGFRQRAIANGVQYLTDQVVGIDVHDGRAQSIHLASGRSVSCGHVVNSSGTRAKLTADMVGLSVPIEPRARTSFVFDCRTEIEHNVPLTVLPEGVHFRREQKHYMTGTAPILDRAVDYDDLDIRHDEFEDQIWPAVAEYVPAFDRISVVTSWGGQYAFNTLDHNLIIGGGVEVPNFYFANGFSGHGMQQSPAVGRGISELITYGEYRTLDMSALGYERVLDNEPFLESVVI